MYITLHYHMREEFPASFPIETWPLLAPMANEIAELAVRRSIRANRARVC